MSFLFKSNIESQITPALSMRRSFLKKFVGINSTFPWHAPAIIRSLVKVLWGKICWFTSLVLLYKYKLQPRNVHGGHLFQLTKTNIHSNRAGINTTMVGLLNYIRPVDWIKRSCICLDVRILQDPLRRKGPCRQISLSSYLVVVSVVVFETPSAT